MAVTPQLRGGSAADTVRAAHLEGSPKSTRKPQATGSAYEKARIQEISRRAELYRSRLARLKANLLDAGEVREVYGEVISGIEAVITKSPLSKTEKGDALGQLLTVGQFVENVSRRKTADSGQKDEEPVALNEGIDQEL